MNSKFLTAGALLALVSCQASLTPEQSLFEDLSTQEGLKGKSEYLASPFVAAGDRVYMIGHQDGSFPDLGWHVEGEMGGIWLHPIKLMDGFTASVSVDGKSFCLDKAQSFTNYPFSNVLQFPLENSGLEVERMQFVPDGKEGMTVLFRVKNVDKSEKSLATGVYVGEETIVPDCGKVLLPIGCIKTSHCVSETPSVQVNTF